MLGGVREDNDSMLEGSFMVGKLVWKLLCLMY